MPTTVEEVEKLSWASFSTWPGRTLTSLVSTAPARGHCPRRHAPPSSSSSQWGLWRAGRRALLAKGVGGATD